MKKIVKVFLIILVILVVVILADTIQAKVFNNTPFIKITEDYHEGDLYQKDTGILVDTYVFRDETKITVFKWEKYTPPEKEKLDIENKENEIKEDKENEIEESEIKEDEGNEIKESEVKEDDVDIEKLKKIAQDYYTDTVWEVVSMKVKSEKNNKVVFEVVSKKDGEFVDPNRTITLKKKNGTWRVTGEGY